VTRSIGGPITPAGLGALLGDRPHAAREHAEPWALALADAADHVRRAAAALRSVEHPVAKKQAEIGRVHTQIMDLETALRTLERWPT
jgi:hypothetical protein